MVNIKKQIIKKGFTLIELIVAITIFMIVTGAAYLNFAYYQNKMNLRLTSKDISQALYNARNMAINGLDSSSGNVSVGVYFDTSTSDKISFFSYPYDLDIPSVDLISLPEKKLLKEINFSKGVQLNDVSSKKKFLFLFQAITGSGSYYYWDATPGKKVFTGDEIDVNISLKGTSSAALSKDIKYITTTNIVDY
nr:type II secretion system protein [Candidatus Gracilibacteria bacterium]